MREARAIIQAVPAYNRAVQVAIDQRTPADTAAIEAMRTLGKEYMHALNQYQVEQNKALPTGGKGKGSILLAGELPVTRDDLTPIKALLEQIAEDSAQSVEFAFAASW